jgi:AcrR family transcriptional regulator
LLGYFWARFFVIVVQPPERLEPSLAVSISSPGERPRVDGRRLRSERTRLVIIEAFLSLLRRDPKIPTAAEIAEAAGCSVRSIFERFADLNALTLATADYALAQAAAEATARDVNADRTTRIRSHVAVRAIACERWLPLWRVLVTTQEQFAELRLRVSLARQGNVARMRLMYGPELATLEEPVREELLVAMAALISFESWDQMRDCFQFSIETAQSAWRAAIDRMLPQAP